MRVKNVQKILSNIFNEFAESIKDESVRKMVKENTIITGGSIVSMLQDQEPKDYDLYFTNKETAFEVAKYYVKEMIKSVGNAPKGEATHLSVFCDDERVKIVAKSSGIVSEIEKKELVPEYQYFESTDIDSMETENFIDKITNVIKDEKAKKEYDKNPYRVVFMSSNAITLSDKIQIIIRFFGNPEEIHKNFDFIHTYNYWLSSDNKLYLNSDALAAILTKELVYVGSRYPIASLIRVRKFLKRGYMINAGQFLKMSYQINDLDLTDLNVLEDQLMGVDYAYFQTMIKGIREDLKGNPDHKINYSYIIELIDKIF